MDVVAMTVLCVDIYEDEGRVCPGGESVNFASCCRELGVREAAIVGAVGNDDHGRFLLDYLDRRGIDRSRVAVREGKTASHRIRIDEKGERWFPEGAWDGGVYEGFILSEGDWAFVLAREVIAIPAGNPNFREALRRARSGNLLACDFNDSRDFGLMEGTIPSMGLAFVSGDDEACERMRALSRRCATPIVVTLGAEGSRAYLRGREYRAPAAKVERVEDTTGCGDAYQAAFCVSYYRDADVLAAMKAGSLAASEILSRVGGAS
jgi:fructoselysine 6-kinase